MRALLIAGLLAAFDPDATIHALWDAEFACLEGQNHDGEAISAELRQTACADMNRARKALRDNGYCFDADRVEWTVCA